MTEQKTADYQAGYTQGLLDARRFFIDCRHDEKSGRKYLAALDRLLDKDLPTIAEARGILKENS